jgi:hypothetical protein
MAALGKLLPLIALAGVGATQKDKIEVAGNKVIDMVKVVVTRHELSTIRTAIMNENAAGTLAEVRENFSEFVKRIVHSDQRDVSRDFWDNPYTFREDRNKIYLRSYGPDGKRKTEDDIVVTLPKR